ncbi:hypothetical protein E3J62_03180 [candidate division TA06 bacterium]|uniref:Uncharacterized protein n=1 Tax=candidate division TA06 bacterium TaxID=2250710 RepID=A0A523UW49_UNCT6|nr:MAG: hypothetical protein E3J62_03180 [candidate division TA06 bacterium]
MAESKEDIIEEFLDYMQQHGGEFPEWYVGISNDAEGRLRRGHKVRSLDPWIYAIANSSNAARDVEDFFVDNLGTDGGTGGGDETSDRVYAYKRAMHTRP